MSKKTAHFILAFFDICCLWGLWHGGHEVKRILFEIQNHVDVVEYINRVCFFLVGMVVPIIHVFTIIEHFEPKLIHKHSRLMNWGAVVLVAGLIFGSIAGSFYLTHGIKSAGYVYCRRASGISALARSVVYTIDDAVCEEVAAKQSHRY